MSAFTKEYFIAKFEAIPEELWTTGDFVDEKNRMCAFGHCGVSLEADTKEGNALDLLFRRGLHTESSSITSEINDGEVRRYPQPTPKQRILAALRDLP